MTGVPDRLAAALADRYRIEREIETGSIIVVENWIEELKAKVKR